MEDLEKVIATLTAEKKTLEKKLQVAEKARKRTENFKNQNEAVIAQINIKLTQTLKQLQLTQLELIQSEKMAGLGQLIAGVSHEINTPAGAIVNSISGILKDNPTFIEGMIQIMSELPQNLFPHLRFCIRTVTASKGAGTSDERHMARDLDKILQAHEIPTCMSFSRNLAAIGFDKENIEQLLPLLQLPIRESLYQFLYILGTNASHTRNIKIGIDKIIRLVKALKLYSHSDQDQIASIRLEEDFETTLIILHNKLKQGITIIKEFEPIPDVKCFADQLNQVWTNLINNAIEAMKGNGRIILRLKRMDDSFVKVEIEDNGPGIETSIRPKIFDPFFTTKPKGEGTGLGLSISKEIIEKHHGTIDVESIPGKTLFTVKLPIDLHHIIK
ncbi:MAG: GHKL domain-containing protein [Parachlamydia sp.]|nr:GHKL domain-containing protein [Parachlamydia sp.]